MESQGKGGDLRSKYDPTLTVARRGDSDPVVFSVCPTGTFILCCELVVFLPVYHTFGRNILYVQLNFLPGVRCTLIRLVLSRLPRLLQGAHGLRCRLFIAAIAPRVPMFAGFFIPHQQITTILPGIPLDQLEFLFRLLPRKMVRCAWLIFQAFQRPIIPLLPFVHRLSAQPIPIRCCCYAVFHRIFQYPLTKVRFLCYLIHGELLCGLVLVALLSYHSRVLFSIPSVPFVLFLNDFQTQNFIIVLDKPYPV